MHIPNVVKFFPFSQKLLSGNEIPTSIIPLLQISNKGMGNNPNLDLVNMNLVKLYPFVLKILGGNEILTSNKGHNSVTNVRKTMKKETFST